MSDSIKEIDKYNGHRMVEISGDGYPIRIGLKKAARILKFAKEINKLAGLEDTSEGKELF